MSGKGALKSGKRGGKSLRKKKRVDYRLMHSGKAHENESSSAVETSSEIDESPWRAPVLGNTASAAPPVSPVVPHEWLVEDDDDKDYDEQMAEISAEMSRLEEEEKKLAKREKLEAMKRELASKRQKVSDLKGTISENKSKHCEPTKTNDTVKLSKKSQSRTDSKLETDLTIHSLRNDEHLQSLVRKELKKMGLADKNDESSDTDSDRSFISSSSSDSDDSSSDNHSNSKSKKKNKKKKKKKKSGISAKASDKVKFPQEWPHAHLQYEHVNKHVKFQDLNFKLLVAGELEILSGEDLSKEERQGRLRLLKKIVYYSSSYEFEGLKAYYAAWLRDIELGIKKWSDDPQEIETAILTKHLLKNKSSTFKKISNQGASQQSDRIWFCSLYQRNKCAHKSTHLQVVKGKQRMATHICATCWQKDKKKLEHPECSSSCPHISA